MLRVTRTLTSTFRVVKNARRSSAASSSKTLKSEAVVTAASSVDGGVAHTARTARPTTSLPLAPDRAEKEGKSPTKRRKQAGKASDNVSALPDATPLPPPLPPLDADTLAAAVMHISNSHPRLAELVAEYGTPTGLTASEGSTFASLARSIVFQQLATRAAQVIWGRFLLACKCESDPTPAAVLATPVDDLRAAGLSGAKAKYVLDLARHYSEGILSDSSISGMGEDELRQQLLQVKGIGPWSVDMFSIFFAGRPDVLPTGDLGVRKGVQILYSLKELPKPAQMESVTESWRPFRSVGSWYMWRLTEAEAARTKKVKVVKTKKVLVVQEDVQV